MLDDNIIRLRALERTDLLTLHEWENLSDLWRSSSTLAPYSLRNMSDYLATYDADPFHAGQLRLMIERITDGIPVGFVELYEVEVRHRRANVGLMIDPKMRGSHMALRALKLMEKYCRAHLLLHQLLAYVPADNTPSLALFNRVGYIHVATLPQWLDTETGRIDALVFQKILNNNDTTDPLGI